MKRTLLMTSLVPMLIFGNLTYANFSFHSSAQDSCEYVTGRWDGAGKVSNWFLGSCTYHGVGVLGSLDSNGVFTAEVTAYKDSGSFFCPKKAKEKFTGVCVNGLVTMNTNYGNLNGSFSQSEGNAQGTLSIAPGMSAEVSIQFQRSG